MDEQHDYDKKDDWAVKTEPLGEPSGRADKALELLQQGAASYQADPIVLKKLVRKIDWMLMPIMITASFLQFIDKTTISYANLFGIQADTGMKGNEFAWLGSAFYIGYLVWQPAAAYLLLRIPIKIHLTTTVVLWGLVLTCTGACTNFVQLCACRVLLGMSESALVPLLSAITGSWYLREEQATRTGFWYSAVGPAQIVGGLVAYGMYELDSTLIKQWQFIFYLLGPITILFGLWIFLVIPSSPATAGFLTPDERITAIERIRANKTGTAPSGIKWYQVREAFRDPRFYLVGVALLSASVPNGGITSFGATIVKGFGYSTRQSTLLGMSTGAWEWVAMYAAIWLSRRTNTRSIPAMVFIAIAVVGALMMVCIPATNANPRYAGYVLIFSWPIGQMMMVSWMQSMISGHSKRTTFYACYQICYAAGNIIGSQTYRPKDAPDYLPAKIGMLACLVLHLLCFGAIAGVNWHYNRVREREVARHGAPDEVTNIEFLDLTDFEIKSFRYPL